MSKYASREDIGASPTPAEAGQYAVWSTPTLLTGVDMADLTKVDDTNVTLTLGGTPAASLLKAVSLTLGWTGTLADGRITSAATWNAKAPTDDPTFTTKITTPTIKITTGTTVGYFWKCTNADGSGEWTAVAATQAYKGTWNATTNTPALADGTGTAGWYYVCNVAGTTDFGSGNITFAVGDQAMYNGTIWEKIPVSITVNLTGPITSVGNATSIASQTGTGTTFVMSASPTLTGNVTFPGTGIWNSSGNVGIGTASPTQKLQINGSGANALIAFSQAGTIKGYLGECYTTDSVINGAVAGDMAIRTEGGRWLFSADAGNTIAMAILANHNIVIGDTTGSQKLTVKGEIGIKTGNNFVHYCANDINYWLMVPNGTTDYKWYYGASNVMSLATSGNLTLIGTITGTQLTSTIASGTAPLVVSSTTLVDNLYVARSVIADTITVEATAETDCSVALFITDTGNLSPKTDAGIKYNATTNVLTVASGTSTQWDAAYVHSQIPGGTGVHLSATERTQWNLAYTHSQDNTQAHTDYLLNSESDAMDGTLTAINFALSSDMKLKSNIKELTLSPLDIKFYKSFNFKKELNQLRYGWIAQDIQKTHPEFVRTDDNGFLSILTMDLIINELFYLRCKVDGNGTK